jgi:hypothetical protein
VQIEGIPGTRSPETAGLRIPELCAAPTRAAAQSRWGRHEISLQCHRFGLGRVLSDVGGRFFDNRRSSYKWQRLGPTSASPTGSIATGDSKAPNAQHAAEPPFRNIRTHRFAAVLRTLICN